MYFISNNINVKIDFVSGKLICVCLNLLIFNVKVLLTSGKLKLNIFVKMSINFVLKVNYISNLILTVLIPEKCVFCYEFHVDLNKIPQQDVQQLVIK